jgi:hypothetical protein
MQVSSVRKYIEVKGVKIYKDRCTRLTTVLTSQAAHTCATRMNSSPITIAYVGKCRLNIVRSCVSSRSEGIIVSGFVVQSN